MNKWCNFQKSDLSIVVFKSSLSLVISKLEAVKGASNFHKGKEENSNSCNHQNTGFLMYCSNVYIETWYHLVCDIKFNSDDENCKQFYEPLYDWMSILNCWICVLVKDFVFTLLLALIYISYWNIMFTLRASSGPWADWSHLRSLKINYYY